MVSTILANLEGCQERVLAGRLRTAFVADRTEAPGARDLLRLRRQLADHLPATYGQEDRSGAEHFGGCT